jgi:glycosyltransferase involved in cell wall biosynthesis
MRILLVMALSSPWSREVAAGLRKLGHEITIADFEGEGSALAYLRAGDASQEEDVRALESQGVQVRLMRSSFRSVLRYVLSARSLRTIAEQSRAEVCLSLYGGGQAMMLLLSGARPYAVYVVGSDVLMVRHPNRLLARLALSRAAAVFSNGRYLAERTRHLSPGANVEPLYLGVRTSEFEVASQRTSAPRIICTRGFLPVYNNEYLIEALAHRVEAAPVRVTFVSKGPTLEDVKGLADRLLDPAQRSAVRFLGGVATSTLRRELAASQVYISLSRSDGTSVSLLEALASGLFPILSDIPQNREWIDPEVGNGILVPLDQPRTLAAAIERAVSDPTLRERASEINRRLVRERGDSAANLERLADRLASVVTT